MVDELQSAICCRKNRRGCRVLSAWRKL